MLLWPVYCGKKVSEADYVIKTPDQQKEKRLCHVNMLKPYYSREQNSLPVQVSMNCVAKMDRQDDSTLKAEEVGRSPRLKNSEVLLNLEQKLIHLPAQEQKVLRELLREFAILFPDIPGQTTIAVHDVDVGDSPLIKQHPYMELKLIRQEVDYMLKDGIIELSQSQWSSPCVLVPKADGTYRFCTDFRKFNSVSKTDSYW